MNHALKLLVTLPRYLLLAPIFLYQKLLSPDHSFWAKAFFPEGYCKFTPSCSEYGFMAVKKYGLARGVPKMIWRVMRCNPWTQGGVDLP